MRKVTENAFTAEALEELRALGYDPFAGDPLDVVYQEELDKATTALSSLPDEVRAAVLELDPYAASIVEDFERRDRETYGETSLLAWYVDSGRLGIVKQVALESGTTPDIVEAYVNRIESARQNDPTPIIGPRQKASGGILLRSFPTDRLMDDHYGGRLPGAGYDIPVRVE